MSRDEFMTKSIDVLLRMLAVQVEGYGRLVDRLRAKREAIRVANLASVVEVCHEERQIIDRIAEVEQSRLRLVSEVAARTDREILNVDEIVELTDETRGEKLRGLAAELKSRILAAQEESSIVNDAAAALSRHMAGLLQTVQVSLAGGGVYGRRGRIAAPRQDLCIDVRS